MNLNDPTLVDSSTVEYWACQCQTESGFWLEKFHHINRGVVEQYINTHSASLKDHYSGVRLVHVHRAQVITSYPTQEQVWDTVNDN